VLDYKKVEKAALAELLQHFFCQSISCWRSHPEVLLADWTRWYSVFVTVGTNQVMFQAGENLGFSSWNFKTNDAFQFSSSFLLDLKHGIHLLMSCQS
jgi:hypothetical protein